MSPPRIVVVAGHEAYERMGRLINSMVNRPLDLTPLGTAMVDLMPHADRLTGPELANSLAGQLDQYILKDSPDDPFFDQRIVIEAVTYGAKAFQAAWRVQAPEGLDCADYRFQRFLGSDLVLERR